MMDIYTDAELLHMQHAAQCKRDRAIMRWLAIQPADRKAFAHDIESAIIDRLRESGRFVSRTADGEHYDLIVDGLRVEVKAASLSGGRYQANLRANDADVLVFVCHDGEQQHYFILPFDRVRGLTHIEIRNADPSAYRGWMAAWRDAWHLIDQYIARGLLIHQRGSKCKARAGFATME